MMILTRFPRAHPPASPQAITSIGPSYRLQPDTAATVSAVSAAFVAVLTVIAAVSGLLLWIDTSIAHSFAKGEAAREADLAKFETFQAKFEVAQEKFEAARKADQDKLEAARKADQEMVEKKTQRLMFAMQRPKHAREIINDMRDIDAVLCDSKYQK
jgi:hypothetical protein